MFPFPVRSDLSLELLERRHARELFQVVDSNRGYLRSWLPWVDATRDVDHIQAFIGSTRQQLYDNNGFQTAIRFRGELVGVIGYHAVDWQHRSTSLGYWLAEAAQGHGTMTECCRAYVAHAFAFMEIHRVQINCAVGNQRSRAIAQRLGFRLEGTAREAEWIHDHFVDHARYAMLASEWGT